MLLDETVLFLQAYRYIQVPQWFRHLHLRTKVLQLMRQFRLHLLHIHDSVKIYILFLSQDSLTGWFAPRCPYFILYVFSIMCKCHQADGRDKLRKIRNSRIQRVSLPGRSISTHSAGSPGPVCYHNSVRF